MFRLKIRQATSRTFSGMLALTMAFVAALVMLPASPAAAASTHCAYDSPAPAWWQICVTDLGGSAYASIRWNYADGEFDPGKVSLQICHTDGTACNTISTAKKYGENYVETPHKATVRAHAYRACSSFSVKLFGHHYDNWIPPGTCTLPVYT